MNGLPEGNILVAVALLGWFPAAIALFTIMRPGRAVIAGFLIAWMFLPMAQFQFRFVPNLDKMTVTSVSLLLGVMIFDPSRLMNFRPRWYDIPILAFCLTPFASSIANRLGAYDGASESLQLILRWGIPYLIGRMYFNTLQGQRDLAMGLFLGGLVYIPFCLYEMRMSPQLHSIVYGYHQHAFIQHYRFGGWRPKVFMQHGLMVGMFMTSAALSGFWLWKSGMLKPILGMPAGIFVAAVTVTALLTRSAGSVLLLFAGIIVLYAVYASKSRLPIVALCVIPMFFVGFRIAGSTTGDIGVALAAATLGEDRAQSLETRIEHETALSHRALEQPVFGWGGWSRARIQDATGRDISITDSLWIIVFGMNGLFGLTMLGLALALPPLLLVAKVPPSMWASQACAPGAVLAVLLGLWIVDSTLNAMISPLYILAMGGLAGMKKIKVSRALRPVRVALKKPDEPNPEHES